MIYNERGYFFMKLERALKEYLTEIEIRKYSPRTLRGYRINLNRFIRFLNEETDVRDTEDLSITEVRQFTKHMVAAGYKGTYINSILTNIKSFTQYCYDEGYGGFNTRKVFKWVKEEKPVIKVFEPSDVKKMLRACEGVNYIDVRDKAIITMLFETGIRCLELCFIKPEDIHSDFIIINGKNHKQRVVPITPILRKAMMKYETMKENYFSFKTVDEAYFLSFRGKELTVGAVEHIMKVRGSGIKDVRVSPHTCRHFFAQQQVKMGTDLYTISRLLGHENISITQTYLNTLRDKDVIQAAKQHSVIMSL